VEPEEMTTARQWLGKHVPAAKDAYAMIKEMLEAVFSTWSVQRLYSWFRKGKLRLSFPKVWCILVVAKYLFHHTYFLVSKNLNHNGLNVVLIFTSFALLFPMYNMHQCIRHAAVFMAIIEEKTLS
jgi:hypothetical protein